MGGGSVAVVVVFTAIHRRGDRSRIFERKPEVRTAELIAEVVVASRARSDRGVGVK
jgi:hypothetical protein